MSKAGQYLTMMLQNLVACFFRTTRHTDVTGYVADLIKTERRVTRSCICLGDQDAFYTTWLSSLIEVEKG